ncbi:MAG TPA: hypothetical protein VN931_04390 [Fibrobacteria bacterium]|nr:hypothetical protein [Fibrobacteria bacterium]
MPWIRELLDAAPSSQIAELHASRLGRTGIVQRTRMRADLEEWISDPVRLEPVEGDARDLLFRLAFAGPRGIGSPGEGITALAADLMAFQTPERDGWHGLEDWGRILREEWLDGRPLRPPPPADRLPSSRAWVEGLAALTARIDLGACRLTRTGDLNRRDRPRLRESFFHLSECGEEAQDECLDLTLSFLSGRELLLARDNRLECHPDLLLALSSPRDLADQVRQWWLQRAFGESRSWWDHVSCRCLSGMDARTVWGWRQDAEVPPDSPAKWISLPAGLRQAVALGLLDARTDSGSISQIGPPGEDLPLPDKSATATADLLVYLAPMSPPPVRRWLEAVSIRESVGLVSRYRLAREPVLEAAAHPILGEELPLLLEAMDPPPSVRRVVQEWLEARRTCQFESLRALRVREPARQKELAALPAVAALVRESIPGWGFVVDPAREAELRRVLQGLGFDPPDPPSPDLVSLAWTSPYSPDFPLAANMEWLMELPADEPRRGAISSNSKYGEGLKELPFQDLMRVAEYATLTDTEVEVVLKGGSQKPLRLRVLRIDKRREPVTLEVRSTAGREDREIALETIRKIRVCD